MSYCNVEFGILSSGIRSTLQRTREYEGVEVTSFVDMRELRGIVKYLIYSALLYSCEFEAQSKYSCSHVFP